MPEPSMTILPWLSAFPHWQKLSGLKLDFESSFLLKESIIISGDRLLISRYGMYSLQPWNPITPEPSQTSEDKNLQAIHNLSLTMFKF